jgi:hypothetical protein
MPRIFISYRREDSSGYALLLYDQLTSRFGKENVFMDVDTLQPGVDFVEVLQQTVASCDVLLVVIGKQWLKVTDEEGNPRLSNPEDFVRLEIAAGLQRDIRVVPLLVAGARIPRPNDLPDVLSRLPRRHAMDVPDVGFHQAVNRLIESLEQAEEEQRSREAADARRKAEEEQRAREAADARRKAEEELRAREAAEAQRKAEEELCAREAAEAQRKAEEELRARTAAESQRKAEEELRARAAEAQRKAEEQRHVESRRFGLLDQLRRFARWLWQFEFIRRRPKFGEWPLTTPGTIIYLVVCLILTLILSLLANLFHIGSGN